MPAVHDAGTQALRRELNLVTLRDERDLSSSVSQDSVPDSLLPAEPQLDLPDRLELHDSDFDSC